MKFSIIVNYRNQPAWRVERCIDSIRSQKHTDFEILVCDDASQTHDAFQYVADVAAQDSRIRPRANLVRRWGHRNALDGFDMARGDILMQVDGDDYLSGDWVLDRIHQEYDEGKDCTWGSCRIEPDDVSHTQVRYGSPLSFYPYGRKFCAASPRTFLRSLYREAVSRWGKNGLSYDIGRSSGGNDIRIFYPILKLAKHRKPIKDVLYIYHRSDPPNDEDINVEGLLTFVEELP